MRTRGRGADLAHSLCADGESNDGGVVACEEVLAPGLETRPLLPLQQLHEPRRLQPPLRLVFSRWKQQPNGVSSDQFREGKKERKEEQMMRTNCVKGGGRHVEEVDEVGDDGGDGCHGRWRR